MWSVTKSVLSTLIGMAIADGVIADLDQPLTRLLPEHRKAMRGDTAQVSLRHLMTMSGGFPGSLRDEAKIWQKDESGRGSYVDRLLERRRSVPPGTAFEYSNFSADLAAAVLAAALARGDRPRTVLGYAQARLFEPLEIGPDPPSQGRCLIRTRPSSKQQVSAGAPTQMESLWAATDSASQRRT